MFTNHLELNSIRGAMSSIFVLMAGRLNQGAGLRQHGKEEVSRRADSALARQLGKVIQRSG